MGYLKKRKLRDTTKANETRWNSAPADVPAPSADGKRALVCSPKPTGTVSFKRSKGACGHRSRSDLSTSQSYSQVAQSVFYPSAEGPSPITARKLSFSEGTGITGITLSGLKPLCSSPVHNIRKAQFSQLKTKDEKVRALHTVGRVCGGDLPGAIKFALMNPQKICGSLCLNAPGRLEEELLDAFREVCPK